MNIKSIKKSIDQKRRGSVRDRGFAPHTGDPNGMDELKVLQKENLKNLQKVMGQNLKSPKAVLIQIQGNYNTMDSLRAAGAKDLAQYFLPNGLKLGIGDEVDVRIYDSGILEDEYKHIVY